MKIIRQQIIGELLEETFLSQFSRYLRLLKYADLFKGKRVLDIACGSGYGTYFIAKYLDVEEVVGVDMDEDAISYAKEHFNGDGTIFINASSYDLRDHFRGNFDIIVSFETIEHVQSPMDYLQELIYFWNGCCAIFLSTQDRDIVSPYVKFPIFRYHLHEFVAAEFISLLNSTNLKIEEFVTAPIQDSLFLKIRKAICFLFSFSKTRVASRLLENIFTFLKRILDFNKRNVSINRKLVDEYSMICLDNNGSLEKRSVISGFFVVLRGDNSTGA
jgi:2-polyprenyl-3-methyl-5-hydroxy-6-metoxy-1,4-benzoquinol methylase